MLPGGFQQDLNNSRRDREGFSVKATVNSYRFLASPKMILLLRFALTKMAPMMKAGLRFTGRLNHDVVG